MKNWKLFFIFCIGVFTQGVQAIELPDADLCNLQLQKKIGDLGALETSWTRIIDPNSTTRAYRKALGPMGHWVEVTIPEKGAPKVIKYTPKATEETVWTGNLKSKCQAKTLKKPFLSLLKTGDPVFKDQDLEVLLKTKKKALIYLWSPRFVYSVLEMKTFEQVAQSKGLEFIPLLEPSVPLAEAQAALDTLPVDKIRGLASKPRVGQKIGSVELYMRSQFQHFPMSFVLRDGKMPETPIVGVMPTAYLEKLLETTP